MGVPYLTLITILPHLVKFLMYIAKLSHKMAELMAKTHYIQFSARVPSSDSDPTWGGRAPQPLECLEPLHRRETMGKGENNMAIPPVYTSVTNAVYPAWVRTEQTTSNTKGERHKQCNISEAYINGFISYKFYTRSLQRIQCY